VTLLIGGNADGTALRSGADRAAGCRGLDDTYGTLGMDALDELKSYTFDYRTMRFAS
jgi:hypothetical protein